MINQRSYYVFWSMIMNKLLENISILCIFCTIFSNSNLYGMQFIKNLFCCNEGLNDDNNEIA